MSTVVKNIGCMENNGTNTNLTKSFGEQGQVNLTIEGVVFNWGPNESKTMEDRLATQALAMDSRLKVAESNNGGGRAVT